MVSQPCMQSQIGSLWRREESKNRIRQQRTDKSEVEGRNRREIKDRIHDKNIDILYQNDSNEHNIYMLMNDHGYLFTLPLQHRLSDTGNQQEDPQQKETEH